MRLTLVLAALAMAASSPAQGFQCSLVGTFNQHGPFNDIWGYVAPNGKEYALLGCETGMVVLDCTNPATPIERGWFPWSNSVWRDIRTFGSYAYVVNEAVGGFQIIDLTNADAPVDLGIHGSAQFTHSHNICIDTGTGRIYCVGANSGTPVFDASSNPTNPSFVGYASAAGNSNYFHDLCVENGYAWGSMIYNGVLRIMDASTFPPATLSNSGTPSAFTHNAWPNAAGTRCVTTDEKLGGLVRFYDTTNKSAPVPLGQFTCNPGSFPHNAFLVGDVCHASWYTEGYQCIDIRDPTQPILIASYDTWPGASGDYNGLWGVYPFQPSGSVYVSDRSTGLYVVRPHLTDLAIVHTPLTDTTDEGVPLTVTATVTSSHALTSVTLHYRLDGGSAQSVVMNALGGNQYAAAIPAQDAATVVDYHIEALDSEAARQSPRIGDNRLLVGTHVTRWFDDFEADLGWTTGGTASDWERDVPKGFAGNSNNIGWQDPLTAFSGSRVRGNDLTVNGAYANSQNSFLQSPAIATNGVAGLRLGCRRFLSLAAGDTARVLVNGTPIWTAPATVYDTGWQRVEYDLSALTNGQSQVVIRFELTTNSTNAAGGWQLDDVELFTRHDCVPANEYGVGTPGTGALVPSLALSAPPQLGTTPLLQGSSMLGNSGALLVMNFLDADVPALGVQLLVDPTAAALLVQLVTAGGDAAWPFAIPSTLSLDNTYLFAQVLALDPASPGGLFSASRGLRFRACISAP